MFFWPQKDGSVTYTGSFNQEQWDAYMAEHGGGKRKPATAKAEPDAEPAAKPESPEPAKKAAAAPAKKAAAAPAGKGRKA